MFPDCRTTAPVAGPRANLGFSQHFSKPIGKLAPVVQLTRMSPMNLEEK